MTPTRRMSLQRGHSLVRRIVPHDGATVLGFYLFLRLALPSDLGVGALGGAGSPASLFGLLMLLWWVWDHLHRPRPAMRSQAVRAALFAFCGCVVASYVVAALSPLPQLDINAADRALLAVASFAGVLLVANDGIPGQDRFLALLRRMIVLVTLYATLGLAQFFTKSSLVDAIQIPGLVRSGSEGLGDRSGFIRAEATATHALEYSSVLSIALPIAITLALHDNRRPALRRWLPVFVIAFAAVLSVSRSGLIGVLIGLIVLFPTWKPAVRRYALLVAAIGMAAVYVLIPGMAGTIVGLFSGATNDSSITSRTSSMTIVSQLFAIHPILGRGLGTLLPTYRILDDQYLGLLVEVGIVGLAAFVAILATATWSALSHRPGSPDPLWRQLGPALTASVAAGAALTLFFDSFSFQQASGLLLMIAGLCGGYRNLHRVPEVASVPSPVSTASTADLSSRLPGPLRIGKALRRRWYVSAGLLLSAVPLLLVADRVPGVYYTSFKMNFLAPQGATAGNPLWTGPGGLVQYAGMVQRLVVGASEKHVIQTVSAPLYGVGVRSGDRVTLPNTGSQWSPSFGIPELEVEVVGPSPQQIQEQAGRIIRQIHGATASPQRNMGVNPRAYITTAETPSYPSIAYVDVRRSRAFAGVLMLVAGMSVAGAIIADRLMGNRDRRRSSPAPNPISSETHAMGLP